MQHTAYAYVLRVAAGGQSWRRRRQRSVCRLQSALRFQQIDLRCDGLAVVAAALNASKRSIDPPQSSAAAVERRDGDSDVHVVVVVAELPQNRAHAIILCVRNNAQTLTLLFKRVAQ